MRKNHPIGALSFPVTAPARDVASTIQILPAGEFDALGGALLGEGPWRLDWPGARRLIAAVSGRINDMVIDYEHQSLLAAQNGKPAPAAGWIDCRSLAFDDRSGLSATSVRWTETAKDMIEAGEYKYLSPVFRYHPKTKQVTDLLNVALTNSPAIDGMHPVRLAAATFGEILFQSTNQNQKMKEQLIQMLGLAETATDDDIVAAVRSLQQSTAAAKAPAFDPAKYVPVGVVTELQTQLAALSAKQEANDIEQLIEKNITRLPTPGLQAWARTQSIAALTAYLVNAPEVAALTGMQSGGKAPAEPNTGLSEDEQAVCRQLGIGPEKFLKTKGVGA